MNNKPQDGEVMLVDNRVYVYSALEDTWHPAPTQWDHYANTITIVVAIVALIATVVWAVYIR